MHKGLTMSDINVRMIDALERSLEKRKETSRIAREILKLHLEKPSNDLVTEAMMFGVITKFLTLLIHDGDDL